MGGRTSEASLMDTLAKIEQRSEQCWPIALRATMEARELGEDDGRRIPRGRRSSPAEMYAHIRRALNAADRMDTSGLDAQGREARREAVALLHRAEDEMKGLL